MPDKIVKFIKSLDDKTKKRLKEKLISLKNNPAGMIGVKKMQGWGEGVYRIRMGKIRVIYKVVGGGVEIIDIDYRGNVY